MFSSKSTRSGSSEMAQKTLSPASTNSRVSSNISKATSGSDAESAITQGRVSVNKSPKIIDRKPSKTNLISEKRVGKGSELQLQLSQAHGDLRKTQDQLAAVEGAKSRAVDELREMKKLAEDANVRLTEALSAQKCAHENSEIQKSRMNELEHASFESAQKRDQAWHLELQAVQKQHALDMEGLLSATQELQRVKQEFSLTTKEKNAALERAEDERRMAEANAKRVEELYADLDTLKESLELVNASRSAIEKERELANAKLETETREATDIAGKTSSLVESLKLDMEKAKDVEVKLAERETIMEKLTLELRNSRDSESQAAVILSESKTKAEMLEKEIEKAKEAETKMLESLVSQTKQLEETKISLEEAKLDIASLKDNIQLLEVSLGQNTRDISVSHQYLEKAKLDKQSLQETVESLEAELQIAKEDLLRAQEKEELAASSVCGLVDDMSLLRNELKLATEAEEKSRKAMDDLALALGEVKTEASQLKEKLELSESELQNATLKAENSRMDLKRTEDKFQVILEEASKEIERLNEGSERAKLEAEESHAAWNEKEVGFVNCIKLSETELSAAKEANVKLINSLREAEEETRIAKEELFRFQNSLEAVEAEVDVTKEAFEMARTENSHLKDSLLSKESELQNITKETEYLRTSEAAALESIKELKRLLAEASNAKNLAQNRNPSFKKVDSDLGKKAKLRVERVNGRIGEAGEVGTQETPNAVRNKEIKDHDSQLTEFPSEKPNGGFDFFGINSKNPRKQIGNKEAVPNHDNMNWSIFDMVVSPQAERSFESIDMTSGQKTSYPTQLDDAETTNSDDFHHIDVPQLDEMENDRTSPTKQRKKKALLRRFGDLLRKSSKYK